MEIEIKIDGKFKTFKQDKVTYKTLKKALEWKEVFQEQVQAMESYIKAGIDGEVDEETAEVVKKIDDMEDLVRSAELIVSYFDDQFTFDDLINGYYINSLFEFHLKAQEIVASILTLMDQESKDTKKK